jgi:hypothetical protein
MTSKGVSRDVGGSRDVVGDQDQVAQVGPGAQSTQDFRGGRAGVEQDGVAVLDQGRGRPADPALFVRVGQGRVGVGRLEGHALAEDRTAVGALDNPLPLEPFQVAADGRFGGAEHFGEHRRSHDLVDLQVLPDHPVALSRNQRLGHRFPVNDYRDACRTDFDRRTGAGPL